ncbi:hypothetical protein Tco_1035908, partial [Tanacetum coccineum]
VSNDDAAVAQRWLEDKQPKEKTNTDCLVKEQEKDSGGRIDAADSLTVLFKVDFDQGFEGLRLSSFARVLGFIKDSMEYKIKNVFGLRWNCRDREAEVFQVSNDDTAVAQRWLEDKQPEEKTNTDCLVKEREKVHLGIKVGANITVTGVPGQEGAKGNVDEKKKGFYES